LQLAILLSQKPLYAFVRASAWLVLFQNETTLYMNAFTLLNELRRLQTLPRPHDLWRVIEPKRGYVHALDRIGGVSFASNGILLAIQRSDGNVVFGHEQWFVIERESSDEVEILPLSGVRKVVVFPDIEYLMLLDDTASPTTVADADSSAIGSEAPKQNASNIQR